MCTKELSAVCASALERTDEYAETKVDVERKTRKKKKRNKN